MNVDFPGRVRKTYLADRQGLQPLFEAVINSIEAIEEANVPRGKITVEITRDMGSLTPDDHGNTIADVVVFAITDNGIGFTNENFASFDAVDSTRKLSTGGKGVGRLLWLKAFERAHVHSVFRDDGKWFEREFEFRPTRKGIERHRLAELPAEGANSTTVRLIGFRPKYQAATPKSAAVIGRRIVEHCLEYFLLNSAPQVEIIDVSEATRVDLNQLLQDHYQPHTETRSFSLNGHRFDIKDVYLQREGDLSHQLHFCAHNRVVRSLALLGRVDHLPHQIETDGAGPAVYHGYVSSDLLDERVDPERTSFNLDRRDDLDLGGEITWDDVVDSALGKVAEALGPVTEEGAERSLRRIESFVAERAPKYRPVLEHRHAAVRRIPAGLTDARLDLELYKLDADWRREVRARTQEQLERADSEELTPEVHERLTNLLGQIEEAAKSELAEYVVQRRAVIEFFQRLLGRQESGRFAREDALHDLIFPRRTNSAAINYDRHNLWLIDERLAYHLHLSSDIPLASHGGPVDVDSLSRPDLLIYNRAMAFADGTGPVSSVVIVEFKRPERNDYVDDINPIRQLTDYVEELRAGKAKRPDGSSIDLPQTVPFYCYLVASRTESLKREAKHQDFMRTPDDQGYFKFHKEMNAYIEIVSYQKVLDDAKKRNRAFFERLNIPTH